MLLCAPNPGVEPESAGPFDERPESALGDDVFRALIRPNRAMTPRGLTIFVICFAALSLTIALSFFSVGLWMVLPFAGVEIAVVAVAVGSVLRHFEDFELIVIDEHTVTITQRRGGHTRQQAFQRCWTRVRREPGRTRLGRDRLCIGSHGRFLDIGVEMTDVGRDELAARLNEALAARASPGGIENR